MLYGSQYYGVYQYADSRAGEEDKNYLDLMWYLPPYWHEMKEMVPLQKAIGYELWSLREMVRNLADQTILSTATYTLSKWEENYGLDTDLTKSYEFRRERLRAKMRGAGTTTKAMIENVASSFAGGDAVVYEYPQDNRFVVKFTGIKGIPANMQDLTATIEEIKPAHLQFDYEYSYNYWNSLKIRTWDHLKPYTWEQLRAL